MYSTAVPLYIYIYMYFSSSLYYSLKALLCIYVHTYVHKVGCLLQKFSTHGSDNTHKTGMNIFMDEFFFLSDPLSYTE